LQVDSARPLQPVMWLQRNYMGYPAHDRIINMTITEPINDTISEPMQPRRLE
jgi:hypothetical protein